MKNKLMLITLSCLTVSFVQSAPSSDLRYVEGLKAMTCNGKVTPDSDWRVQPKNKVVTYKGRVVSQGVAEQFEKCQSSKANNILNNESVEKLYKDLNLSVDKIVKSQEDLNKKTSHAQNNYDNHLRLLSMKPASLLTTRPTQELINRRHLNMVEDAFGAERKSFEEIIPSDQSTYSGFILGDGQSSSPETRGILVSDNAMKALVPISPSQEIIKFLPAAIGAFGANVFAKKPTILLQAAKSLKLKANPQLLLASGITPFDIVRKANQNDAKLAYMKPGSGALLDFRNLRTAFKNTPTTVVAASAATGFAKKPTILLQAAKSMKAIPVRGKVGLGIALAGTAGTIVYKKYLNNAQDATEVVELSTPEVVGTESTPTVETPSKTEPVSMFQNLKASTWDKELFGYKNGGKVATTAALTVAVGTVSYAAYKAYVYRHVIKAYISSKNPFSKSN